MDMPGRMRGKATARPLTNRKPGERGKIRNVEFERVESKNKALSLCTAQPRIEHVPQGIAKEVEREYDYEDGNAGENHNPPRREQR